jgi:hypothetical protein
MARRVPTASCQVPNHAGLSHRVRSSPPLIPSRPALSGPLAVRVAVERLLVLRNEGE